MQLASECSPPKDEAQTEKPAGHAPYVDIREVWVTAGHKRSEATIRLALVSHRESDFSPVSMYDGAERGPFPSEPRVYRISAYGNQSMSSSTRQQDLADYPALGRAANDYAYIDQVDSATDEEEDPLSNLDDDSISDQFDDLRVEDEDWEIAERGLSFFLFLSSLGFCLTCFFSIPADFTKQYNRLRQHVAVRSQHYSAETIPASLTNSLVVPLPAINRPTATNTATTPLRKDKTGDQLTVLSKFSSRISEINQPYDLGVSVNRKGPSQHANLKGKSDRATNEQVLDPRTRIILYKMIGRELIYEVNGCVSTGKEVSRYLLPLRSVIVLNTVVFDFLLSNA